MGCMDLFMLSWKVELSCHYKTVSATLIQLYISPPWYSSACPSVSLYAYTSPCYDEYPYIYNPYNTLEYYSSNVSSMCNLRRDFMLTKLITLFNSLFVTEPTSWTLTWEPNKCDTCHGLLLEPDGSLQRFPDSQQMIGGYCKSNRFGDECKVGLLSPYYYNHSNLVTV